MKKQIILLLTLAIPVAVFLFLKIFGENKYEIPVFFAQGIEGCGNPPQQHTVNLESLNISPKNHCVVAVMDSNDNTANRTFVTELVRIQDAFYGRVEPQFILLTNSQSVETHADMLAFCKVNGLNPEHTILLNLNAAEKKDFTECGLGLGKPDGGQPTDLALIDDEGKIRGFYLRNDKEETDRLILELKILKND
jgi:protein SCO1